MLLLLPLSMFPFWIIIFGQLNFNWKSMVGPEKTACHVSGEEQTCLNPPSQAHPQFPTSNYSWDGAKSLSCKSWFRLHPAEVTRFRYPFLVKRCSSAVPHTTVGKAAQQPAGARKYVGRSLPAPNGFLQVWSSWYSCSTLANCSGTHKGNTLCKCKTTKGVFSQLSCNVTM